MFLKRDSESTTNILHYDVGISYFENLFPQTNDRGQALDPNKSATGI